MYRGAAVLFGAQEMEARNPGLELRPPCIEGPPYYLAQRRPQRRAGGGRRRRRSGLRIRNLTTPTPERGEKTLLKGF